MSATPSGTPAPWSHAINKNDHGPLVSIAAGLMLAGMLLFLVIRMAIRWPWSRLLGWDDGMTFVGSLLAVGQSVAIFRAVHDGLGRHEDDLRASQFGDMEKDLFVGDVLFVFTLVASKLAVSLLLLRLSTLRPMILASHVLMGIIGLWGFASVLAVAIRPHASSPWVLDNRDASRMADVWIGVGAMSILIEVALVGLPIFLVWPLQMPLSSKLTVIAGFEFRLPVAILSLLRILASRTALLKGHSDLPWQYVVFTIYTQIELNLSLIAATIPCMHVFLKNFNTGYLGTTADQVDTITGTMAATKGSNSYVMSTVRSRHTPNSTEKHAGGSGEAQKSEVFAGKSEDEWALRPPVGATMCQVVHRGDSHTEVGSVESDASDRIMVRKTVQVDWDRDGSR